MNAILVSLGSAFGGMFLKMILGVFTNQKFLESSFLFLAEKLANSTSTDVDNKLLELARKALGDEAPPAEGKEEAVG